jgi:Tol biopolymer transport system component
VTEISGRLKAKVCEGCSPIGWSPDSEILSVTLVGNLTKNDSSFYSVAERREVARFVHPKYGALAARFSPDGRWVALNVKFSDSVGVIHLVPWTGSAVPPEKWIPITEAPSSAHLPEWSPDGQFVYYISNRFGSYDL